MLDQSAFAVNARTIASTELLDKAMKSNEKEAIAARCP